MRQRRYLHFFNPITILAGILVAIIVSGFISLAVHAEALSIKDVGCSTQEPTFSTTNKTSPSPQTPNLCLGSANGNRYFQFAYNLSGKVATSAGSSVSAIKVTGEDGNGKKIAFAFDPSAKNGDTRFVSLAGSDDPRLGWKSEGDLTSCKTSSKANAITITATNTKNSDQVDSFTINLCNYGDNKAYINLTGKAIIADGKTATTGTITATLCITRNDLKKEYPALSEYFTGKLEKKGVTSLQLTGGPSRFSYDLNSPDDEFTLADGKLTIPGVEPTTGSQTYKLSIAYNDVSVLNEDNPTAAGATSSDIPIVIGNLRVVAGKTIIAGTGKCFDSDASSTAADVEENENGESTCPVDGIGWMVCPLLNAIGGLNDAMYSWVESVLILNPLQMEDEGVQTPQYQTWQRVRDIANVLLVIAFIIIIFSQLTSVGITNYGVKKLLPRVILVAIAINVSYIVMQISIDLVNIIGVGLHQILDTTAVADVTSGLSTENIVGSMLTGTALAGVGATVGAAAIATLGISAGSLVLLALPFIIVAMLSLLAAVATLFLRNALIIVLVVTAPVAIAAYLLPNTEQLFTKWRKLFVSMLVLFPMAALLFAGAKFAAYVTVSSNQPLAALVALFIMGAPLGALPFLIKSSNAVLSSVGNRLQGLAQSARNPLQKALKPEIDKMNAQNKAGQRGFFGRRFNEEKLQRRRDNQQRTVAQKLNDAKITTEKATKNANSSAENSWGDRASSGRRTSSQQRANREFHEDETLTEEQKALKGVAQDAFKTRALNNPGSRDQRAYRMQADANASSEKLDNLLKSREKSRVLRGDTNTVNGENLLINAIESHGAAEDTKAVEGQIVNITRGSGIADAAVQQQKANDQTGEELSTGEQAIFDRSVQGNVEGRLDTALNIEGSKLESAAATAAVGDAVAAEKNVGGSMFGTEMERRSFDKDAASRTARTDQAEIEAATNSQSKYLNLVGSENRERLQEAKRRDEVAKEATGRAQRLGQEEYYEAKTADTPEGEELARRAAGIDIVHGEALSRATAYEGLRKSSEESANAYSILFEQQGIPQTIYNLDGTTIDENPGSKSLLGIALDSKRTQEERDAAGNMIATSGNIDAAVPYQNFLMLENQRIDEGLEPLEAAEKKAQQDAAAGLPVTPVNQTSLQDARKRKESIQKLQKAYAQKLASGGKSIAVGAQELEDFRTGTAKPPVIKGIPDPVAVGLDSTDLLMIRTITSKGVAPSTWSTADKNDLFRIKRVLPYLPEKNQRLVWESINDMYQNSDFRGPIKPREMQKIGDIYYAIPTPSRGPNPQPIPSTENPDPGPPPQDSTTPTAPSTPTPPPTAPPAPPPPENFVG